MKNKINNLIELFESSLFPFRCPCCDDILKEDRYGFCISCIKTLNFVQESRCLKCGKHLEDESVEYCDECLVHQKTYEKGYPLLVYDAISARIIYDFKYNNKREYARSFAKLLFLKFEKAIKKLEIDVLVPIPIHKSRLKIREYNQAELLAKFLGRYIHINIENKLIYRIKKTKALKDLSKNERKKCLKEAFAVDEKLIEQKKIKKVLLVDDIYTTGATIEECTKALKIAGVEKVYYISVCIA